MSQTCFGAVLKGHICLHVPSSFLLTQCQLYPKICSSPGNGAWPHFSRMHCNPWIWLVGAKLNTPGEAPFAQTLLACQLCRTDAACRHRMERDPAPACLGHGFLRVGRGCPVSLTTCKGGEVGGQECSETWAGGFLGRKT